MSRQLQGRLVVTGTLRATSPIHVGGRSGEDGVDLALARDGAGRWYVPGTGLAGPIRAWLESRFPDVRQNRQLLGALVGPRYARGDDWGGASLLYVEDAVVDAELSEVRDGVGIDRKTGAAADGIKFDRAVLPVGARFPLQLTVELPTAALIGHGLDEGMSLADGVAALVGHLVDALSSGRIGFGAARTRGLGDVALDDVRITEQRFDRAGMLDLLRHADPLDGGEVRTADELKRRAPLRPAPERVLDVTVHWQPAGPLMVKAGVDGFGVDAIPLVTATGAGVALVLPGSSVKGALRTWAGRIVRTALERDLDDGVPHHRQVRAPVVDLLFGTPADDSELDLLSAGAEEQTAEGPRPGRAALSVSDTTGRTLPGSAWAAVVEADSTAAVTEALDAAGLPAWRAAYHVAIDRWTGGAAEQLLFAELQPDEAGWGPLRLRLDFDRVGEADRPAVFALLLLVLDDLSAGRIPLGYGTNRGFGSVEATSVELAIDDWSAAALGNLVDGPLRLETPILAALDEETRKHLAQHWSRALESA